jgi:hypothetical protein
MKSKKKPADRSFQYKSFNKDLKNEINKEIHKNNPMTETL